MVKLVYGLHSVSPLLWQSPELITALYVDHKRQDKRLNELIELAQQKGVAYQLVETKQLQKMAANGRHQGVIAEIAEQATNSNLSLKDLIASLKDEAKAVIMVLDGVTDPHNLGAIIRSCDCFGVKAVIIPKDNSASVNATVAKVAAGALSQIPVVVVNNLARSLEQLKEAEYWIAGTTLAPNSISLFTFEPAAKMVWVMGSEGNGIRRLVAENCDYLVSIPMSGQTQSLNVSVAAGVVLAYTQYQRQLTDASAL